MHSKDAQMLVLTVLAEGPMHGYAINTAIEAGAGERLDGGVDRVAVHRTFREDREDQHLRVLAVHGPTVHVMYYLPRSTRRVLSGAWLSAPPTSAPAAECSGSCSRRDSRS